MQSLRGASRPVGQLTETLFRPPQFNRVLGLTSITSQVSLIRPQTRAFGRSPCFQVDSEPQGGGTEHIDASDYFGIDKPENIDHKIPDLPKPWRVSDLAQVERAAYAKYGPNYTQHVSAEEREEFQRFADQRASRSLLYEKRYGPQWHDLVREAMKLRHVETKASLPTRLLLQKKSYELRVRRRALLNQGATYEGSAELREIKRNENELHKQEAELVPLGLRPWVKRAKRLRLERPKGAEAAGPKASADALRGDDAGPHVKVEAGAGDLSANEASVPDGVVVDADVKQ